MQRRQFLFGTGTALAAGLIRPAQLVAADSPYLQNIGLQLWTVRNQLSEDAASAMKAVAAAGYRQVELMNVLQSDEIRRLAADNGLEVRSAFIEWTAIGNPRAENAPEFDRILEHAAEAGLKYLVFGYIGKGHRETTDHFRGHAERSNKAGEKCRSAGIQLCYHNHSFEFAELENGKTGFDVFTEEFDEESVTFELDVFWVRIGGRDVLSTMKQLRGRISQLHLKDLQAGTPVLHDEGKVPADAFQELGDGTISMQPVLQLAEEIGVEYCHVEQDQSPDPLDSIRQSMQHLRSL